MPGQPPFIPYPSIGNHAATGDRRTAALVAADGTVDWLCLPNYDGASVFSTMLDAGRGGFWRIGPALPISGTQRYLARAPAVVTAWKTESGELELTDLMVWPEENRQPARERQRVLVRRLRCTAGQVPYVMCLRPRRDFDEAAKIETRPGGVVCDLGDLTLGLWTSFRVAPGERGIEGNIEGNVEVGGRLHQGATLWAVLALNEEPGDWSVEAAKRAFRETLRYWNEWLSHLTYAGPRGRRMERSALTIHLLGYAPDGSLVAAPTTSLPERIGGQRNYDYRYAWVRDASLSMAGLALLGDTATSARYLAWLSSLDASTNAPLRPVYHISGDTTLDERQRTDLAGYRGSPPVRFGNRAARQLQLGSLGYLCDCALIHLERGGAWQPADWDLVRRGASFIAHHWREPDSGIWELPRREHYTSSKVLSWVVLDRALAIARRTGQTDQTDDWEQQLRAIFDDVMAHGWSERQQSFVQRYGSEALDASALLIPVMGFLSPHHQRVRSTVDRLAEALTIDGLVYRFDPMQSPVEHPLPLGEFEGAFLPCTFWLATAYALAGRVHEAEVVLRRAESVAGAGGLFAEEADARNGEMLGNYPLLFSQVEYMRAVLALDQARVGGQLHAGSLPADTAVGDESGTSDAEPRQGESQAEPRQGESQPAGAYGG